MRMYDMKTEDIVEALNIQIESKRKSLNIDSSGHVVIQKIITINPTFKAYKKYSYTLWFVKAGHKYMIVKVQETAKILEGQEETVIRRLNIELSRQIFNLIDSELFKQIVQGEYAGADE